MLSPILFFRLVLSPIDHFQASDVSTIHISNASAVSTMIDYQGSAVSKINNSLGSAVFNKLSESEIYHKVV